MKNKLNELMSKIPEVENGNVDKELLRFGIIAELDAVNLYEQMARLTKDEKLKKVFLDVAKEEKTHVGEFQELLNSLDAENETELKNGAKEVDDMTNSESLKEARKRIYGESVTEQINNMMSVYKKLIK